MFVKFFQNKQENICARTSFVIKMKAEACNFIKKETQAQVFSCQFSEIFRSTFLQNTGGRLFLRILKICFTNHLENYAASYNEAIYIIRSINFVSMFYILFYLENELFFV